ncbi:Hypothetical protein A7982_08604 [Minicystis rosea]|nr:Hypothetical protein A7982_08604 [Minicystis rosea]
MLTRVLPEEQVVGTPVPIYIEGSSEVTAALVYYKPFGMTRYTRREMERFGRGFATLIPCDAVMTTGDLEVVIRLGDADGKLVDEIGTIKAPIHVRIRHEIDDAPPALPRRKPPAPCCPP